MMTLPLLPIEGYWTQVRDGDSRVAQMYMRHYSCHQYKDGRRGQYGYRNRFLVMGPGEKKIPGALDKALTEAFGSVAKFKEDFAAAGAGQFGSGWAWLVKDKDGSLKITKTENGVNPLCFGQTALLGCDVWEHSYYIDFRNKRPAYLTNFLDKLVNWENVASRL